MDLLFGGGATIRRTGPGCRSEKLGEPRADPGRRLEDPKANGARTPAAIPLTLDGADNLISRRWIVPAAYVRRRIPLPRSASVASDCSHPQPDAPDYDVGGRRRVGPLRQVPMTLSSDHAQG